MRKYAIYMLVHLLVLYGCGFSESAKENAICSAFENLYNSNFSYLKEDNVYSDGEHQRTLYIGKYSARPYVEYVFVPEGNIYQHLYYYEGADCINAKVNVNGEWQEQIVNREYFYGYGENITILQEKELTIENTDYIVYNTEFELSLNKKNSGLDNMAVKVPQEYYIEKQSGKIERIVTYLSDLQKEIYIVNDMSVNGTSFENASQNANKMDNFERIVDVSIEYEKEDFQIVLP
ncbi:MAG: hypothetical protein IKB01_09730 [Lachnospiraceae bacterium]|nr:hypothetical protein [Lachnospiraceae bacterium]